MSAHAKFPIAISVYENPVNRVLFVLIAGMASEPSASPLADHSPPMPPIWEDEPPIK